MNAERHLRREPNVGHCLLVGGDPISVLILYLGWVEEILDADAALEGAISRGWVDRRPKRGSCSQEQFFITAAGRRFAEELSDRGSFPNEPTDA